jgi:hypothetical protein
MAAPTNYRTEAVEIGANTYSKPVQTGIGQVLGGLFEMAGQAEQKRALGVEQQEVEQARSEFFGEMTQAQKDYADITSAKMAGQEYTPEQQAVLNKYGSETAILQAAVEQGALKYHQFRTRQEGLLRDFKRDRPDLAAEADKMYAGALGFDVRGAAMDYYNFLLEKSESKVALANAQAKSAQDSYKDTVGITKQLIEMQPSDMKVPLMEQFIRIQSNVAQGVMSVTAGQEAMNEITKTYRNTASLVVADANLKVSNTFTSVQNQANSILSASASGQMRVGPDGKLDNMALENLGKLEAEIFSIEDLAARVEATSPATADAYRSKAKYLLDRVQEARNAGTAEVLLKNAKSISELSALQMNITDEAMLLDMSKIFYNKQEDRDAWVKSVAPSVIAGKSLQQQMMSGATPWTVKFPMGVTDKLSGTVVNKLFNQLSVAPAGESGKVVPVLTDSLYSYGAQRVDGSNRVIARSPEEIFSSSGSLYAFTSEQFAESKQAKALLSLSKQERTEIAYGIAMNLDRYNEYVIAAASRENPNISRAAVRTSQLLDMIETGRVPANAKYQVAHSSVDKNLIAPFDSYGNEAARTWDFVKRLVQ